jgi:hypothetical protein
MKKLSFNIAEGQEEDFNYQKIYNKTLVDLSVEIMLPPTALGIGYHDYKGNSYLNNTFSYGEFSTIVARSKSKKTFCKSAFIAGYIGGNTENFFPSFKTCRVGEPHIIDIDTEQGEYYAQRAFRRVSDMVGSPYHNYFPFGMEELEPGELIKFIDSLFKDPKHKGKIKWLSIDGIADLVKNPNDIIESVEVATKLKKWRKENNCHIQTVIHKVSGGDKATGHLGSYVQKKSESVIDLRDTDEDPKVKNSPIEVVQSYSRGAPFDPFYFKLNENTLPFECENELTSWK